MTATFIHDSLHLLAPGFIAWLLWRKNWIRVWFWMTLTMLVDLDHLLATPIYDANRCSINFHPLHSLWAFVVYIILAWWPAGRIASIGLLWHMLTDSIDCLLMLQKIY